MSGETQMEFRPTWAAWFWTIVLTAGFALPYVWWKRRAVRYEVTDSSVIEHRGRVSTKTDEFLLDDVTRVQTHQSLSERLLGGGSITLDTGPDELTLTAVPNHEKVVSTIQDARSS